MALVAYDNSDISDDSESDTETDVKAQVILKNREVNNHSTPPNNDFTTFKLPLRKDCKNVTDDEESDSEDEGPIDINFSCLPKPQYHSLHLDESKIKTSKSGILKKLISSTSKITSGAKTYGPSLLTKTNKESGLLSMLPSPANDSDNPIFTTKSEDRQAAMAKLLPTAVRNNMEKQMKKAQASAKKDDDDDSDGETDFFSLSKVDKIDNYEDIVPHLNIEINLLKDIHVPEPKVTDDKHGISFKDSNAAHISTNADESDMSSNSIGQLRLDEEAKLQLFGRKYKEQAPDNIQVIDIREDDILAETKRNLTKRLTEEVPLRPSSSKFGGSALGKRKHQITYLAYQAKERELELKNQWAQSRFTRKQTQSKYGF